MARRPFDPWNNNFPGLPMRPRQSPLESQAPVARGGPGGVTFAPYVQPDIRSQNVLEPTLTQDAFVLSQFDARPLYAVDFNSYTGTNLNDLIATSALPLNVVSSFYTVPAGRVAILRSFGLDLACFYTAGEAGTPVINADGTSNFWTRLGFFIDGIPQDQESDLIFGNAPFGPMEGSCYIIAGGQQTIEMRVTGLGVVPTVPTVTAVFNGALLSMYGNVLRSTGREFDQEPAMTRPVPVTKGAP